MINFIGLLITVLISVSGWSMPLEVIPGEIGSFELRVRLSVDGIERDFQLDTGADSTIVAPDDQMMKYPVVGRAPSRGASGVKVECDLIRPVEMIFDKRIISSPQLKRCDFGRHSLNNLGLDILSGNILKIDAQSKSLDLLEGLPGHILTYPLERLDKGHVRMRIRLMKNSIGAVFDTGAQLTAIDLKYAEKNQHLKRIGEIDGGRDITGAPVKMVLYEIPHLQVDDFDFQNVSVLAFDFQNLRDYLGGDTPLIIGNNLILQASWLIDLKNNRWAVLK